MANKNTCPLDHSTYEKFVECDCNYGSAREVWDFLQQEIEKFEDLEEKLEVAMKALEFYASKGNWCWSSRPKKESHLAWAISPHDCGWCKESEKFVGGRIARAALARIKEMENEE